MALIEGTGEQRRPALLGLDHRSGEGVSETLAQPSSHDDLVSGAFHLALARSLSDYERHHQGRQGELSSPIDDFTLGDSDQVELTGSCDGVGSLRDAQLAIDVFGVRLDGVERDVEVVSHLALAHVTAHQSQNGKLTIAELVQELGIESGSGLT